MYTFRDGLTKEIGLKTETVIFYSKELAVVEPLKPFYLGYNKKLLLMNGY